MVPVPPKMKTALNHSLHGDVIAGPPPRYAHLSCPGSLHFTSISPRKTLW